MVTAKKAVMNPICFERAARRSRGQANPPTNVASAGMNSANTMQHVTVREHTDRYLSLVEIFRVILVDSRVVSFSK